MTTVEIRSEFNLYYDNLASNLAPGLDGYEISVYLTRAYEQYVDALYADYEQNEKVRKILAPLVKSEKLQPVSVSHIEPSSHESHFFKLSNNVKYIVYEHIHYNGNADRCVRNNNISVTPVTHDDFTRVYKDPFKYNKKRALRLDISDNSGSVYAEIIAKDSRIDHYFIRYIMTPKPIIVDDINPSSINGFDKRMECPLNDKSIREIIELAAKLAYADYKQVSQ